MPDIYYADYNTADFLDYNVEAINHAIKNILNTAEGTLPGKPDFGSRLNQVVFSQLDYITVEVIKRLIQEALFKWEKRIIVENVDVQTVPEYNKVIAQITYSFVNKALNTTATTSIVLEQ